MPTKQDLELQVSRGLTHKQIRAHFKIGQLRLIKLMREFGIRTTNKPGPKRQTARFCICGGNVRRQNKYCDVCIENEVHRNRRNHVDAVTSDQGRRNVLLREIGNLCQICETTEWRGYPVPLIMDHIDGNSDNNTRENLRLICPNCDAQLPTFKARNRGKGRHSRRERYRDGKSY